ncbi:hypothetical protein PENSPDRAFT_82683 [Peniophora sp. CONT]|nr:hypothetical protein PENSPDRAFT_82683 [Peniophora sp. CONT]
MAVLPALTSAFRARMITKLDLHTEADASILGDYAGGREDGLVLCEVNLVFYNMALDMSVLPPRVRSLLQNPPTPDPKFMGANSVPFAFQFSHMWRRDPLWNSITQGRR